MKNTLFTMGEYELEIFRYNRTHGTSLTSLDFCKAEVQKEFAGRTNAELNDWERLFRAAQEKELVERYREIQDYIEKNSGDENFEKKLVYMEQVFVNNVNWMFVAFAKDKKLDITRYSKEWHTSLGEDYGTSGPNMVPPEYWNPGDPHPEQ